MNPRSQLHPHPSPRPPKAAKLYKVAPEVTALDRLAALAEGFYALEHDQPAAMDVDPVQPSNMTRSQSRASATPAPAPAPAKNVELVVESQEDLKALTHIRKMMLKQQAWQDPRVKATLMGYFEGDMIVVSGMAARHCHRRESLFADCDPAYTSSAAARCLAKGKAVAAVGPAVGGQGRGGEGGDGLIVWQAWWRRWTLRWAGQAGRGGDGGGDACE